MVAERTPTRYQRIRLFVSSSSPLALYPNTLYSTLSSRADLACSLSCCNPWILSSHPSRSRSTPPLLYIVPRAMGTMRQFSGSKAGGIVAIPPPYIGSRTTSLSGWNRRYPADRATRKCRVEHGFRTLNGSISAGAGARRSCSRRDFQIRRSESLFRGRIDVADVRNHHPASLGEF